MCLPGLLVNLRYFIFCLSYRSCFVNLAMVMGLLYRDLPQLWVNVINL